MSICKHTGVYLIAILMASTSLLFGAYANEISLLNAGSTNNITGGNYSQSVIIGYTVGGQTQSYNTNELLNANNIFRFIYQATADVVPPVCNSIIINSGDTHTNQTNVNLAISASDETALTYMSFSNDNNTWSSPVAYSSSYSWTIAGDVGTNTVYVKVQDSSGNWSGVKSDTIIYDNTPPSAPDIIELSVVGGALGSGQNTLTAVTTNTTPQSGATLWWRFQNGSSWTSWTRIPTTTGYNGDGTTIYYIEAKYIDEAGNQSGTTQGSISSVDRLMSGVATSNASFPWTSEANPPVINWFHPLTADLDQNNYDVYWGPLYNGSTVVASGQSNSYDPPIISSGGGTYYLRVRAYDAIGNPGAWKTVAVYYYVVGDSQYFLEDDAGVTTDTVASFTDRDNVELVRKDSAGDEVGSVSINVTALGIDITQDVPKIVIEKDDKDNPFVFVPSDSDFAVTVNNKKQAWRDAGSNPAELDNYVAWVEIKLGPYTSAPIITVATENAIVPLTDYNGEPKADTDRIKDYYWNPATGYVTFKVNEFSTYGSTQINNIVYEYNSYYGDASATVSVRAKVIDENNDGVEGAPVTFSIVSGKGTFNTATSVTSDAQGWAVVEFQYDSDPGTTILRALTTTNIQSDTYMVVSGGLTGAELAAYNSWAASYLPYEIGGPGNDYDSDGVINLYEWNYGVSPMTDPTDTDTDDDDISDKWDAAPTDNSTWVYNSSFNQSPKKVDGKLFGGTAVSTNIISQASGAWLSHSGGNDYANEDGHDNITVEVMKISGLAHERVYDGNLGHSYQAAGNLYRQIQPGREYSVMFTYINRGNAQDSFAVDVDLEQMAERWSTFNVIGVLNDVSRWQQLVYEVKVLPTNAQAYERATLNIDLSLTSGTARSYNGFGGAYTGGTFDDDGAYGGVGSSSYSFVLEAEGVDLTFLGKQVTVTPPDTYTGLAISKDDLVPGTKIKYEILVRNNNGALAPSVNLTDNIPNNCHLYYTDIPAVVGSSGWSWEGAKDNDAVAASSNAVHFIIDIPGRTTVSASYTVTVD